MQMASQLEQIELQDENEKKARHRQALDRLIEERIRIASFANEPITKETLRQMRLHPEQIEKLKM